MVCVIMVIMVVRMSVRMVVAMVGMSESQNPDDIDKEAKDADSHELIEPLDVTPH